MKIQLDKFKIISDERQFIVLENKPIQASKFTNEENIGKERWVEVAYIGNIEYLVRYISKRIVLEEDDLSDAVVRIKALQEQAREMDKKLNIEYRAI